MLFTKFITGIRRFDRSPAAAALHGLHSPDRLRTIIHRERDRTDRTGEGFVLLTLSNKTSEPRGLSPRQTSPQDKPGGSPVELAAVARIIKNRMRSTDEAGWSDCRTIVVVMPSTKVEGARVFINDVLQCLPDGYTKPACSIRCYPESRLDDGASERPSRSARVAGGRAEGDAPAVPGHRLALPQPPNEQSVGAMNMLFTRRLPIWKRFLDVLGAGVGLVLLMPLFALVAIAIKSTSSGPIFFRQYRSGLGGRRFAMYKFRSMVVDAEDRKQALMPLNEQDGPAFKIKLDPRITTVGKFIRRTNIDELPQLWNVLCGDMSLVGPRPLPCDETAACQVWHHRRLDATPGLTCTWQISDRSKVSFADWVRMDIHYIRSRSIWGDLKLLVGTAVAVVFPN